MIKKRETLDTLERQGSRKYTQKNKEKIHPKKPFGPVGWVLVAALALVLGLLGARLLHYRQAEQEYQAYRQLAAQEAPWDDKDWGASSSAPPGQAGQAQGAEVAAAWAAPIPLEALPPASTPLPQERPQSALVQHLQAQNSDAVGWLDVKGTTIQYPIVRGGDNEYYTTHTFDRTENACGAIFMDTYSQPDGSGFNTVLYGHNMKDGSMFATLDSYESQAFADKHLDIEVQLLDRRLHYKVFSAYVSKGREDFDFRGQTAHSRVERQQFVLEARKRAVIYSKQAVAATDRLLTLVTCTNGSQPWYFVVHAVLQQEEEYPAG